MRYEYALDLLTEEGRPLLRAVVTPDWRAALEWVHFEAVRAGSLPAETRTGPGEVEPIWDARLGAPYVATFRVTVGARDGRTAAGDIPKTYLRPLVQDLAAALVAEGRLDTHDTFRWRVNAVALADGDVPKAPPADPFDVEDVGAPLPIDEAPLGRFLDASAFVGGDDLPRLVPVFIPQSVLDEAKEMARRSPDAETGGVLIGKLHRDDGADARAPFGDTRELFVEVTAQVPALHTVASTTKLTFTAATWAAVRSAIALRDRGEIMVGWHHSHLDWCRIRNCPPERRRVCSGSHPFFSREDVHLHGCFPCGYHVALLTSDSAALGGLTASVFGWFEGAVVHRGFHVLDDSGASRAKGIDHAENITRAATDDGDQRAARQR